jgi:phosphate transport system permease protein
MEESVTATIIPVATEKPEHTQEAAFSPCPDLRRKPRPWERLIRISLGFCTAITIITTLGIIWVLFSEAAGFFRQVSFMEFFTDTQWTPLFYQKHYGILPLVTATVIAAGIALLTGGPLGLLAAIWLAEYAPDSVRKILKPVLEILAGIPTIVYGYFALLFVTPVLRALIPDIGVFNALSPGIVMGIMILPLVASLSEDAMIAVPRSLREAAYALGATKQEVCLRVVFPSALSGILASFILGISRAIGETMIVTIAMGQQPTFTFNPLQAMETMTAYIVQVSLGDTPHGTIEYQTIFAVGLMLFIMTLILNLISYRITKRYREVYQ